MKSLFRHIVILSFCFFGASFGAFALEAGLSSDHIEIHTDFSGERLLVFGTLNRNHNQKDDLVIIVRGPQRVGIIWQKKRVGGIWINERSQNIGALRGFYAISSSALTKPAFLSIAFGDLDKKDLGGNELGKKDLARNELAQKNLLIERLMAQQGLFTTSSQGVRFLGARLFEAQIDLPTNAPIGQYQVIISLLRDGQLREQITLPFRLNKKGLGAVFILAR